MVGWGEDRSGKTISDTGMAGRGQGLVSLRLMTSQFKYIVTHMQKLKTAKYAYFAVYGFKILCEISKVPFEISHTFP